MTLISENTSAALKNEFFATQLANLKRQIETKNLLLKANLIRPDNSLTYPFVGPIAGDWAADCIVRLLGWQKSLELEGRKETIVINLTSQGAKDEFGALFTDTFALIDTIRRLQAKGHKVVVQVNGFAAMQAVSLLQIANRRVITPNSELLISAYQFPGFNSQDRNLEDEMEYRRELELQINNLIIDRSGIDADTLKENTKRGKQWWLDANQAVEYGLVDEVGTFSNSSCSLPTLDTSINANASLEDQIAQARIILAKIDAIQGGYDLRDVRDANLSPHPVTFFAPVVSQVTAGLGQMLTQFSCVPNTTVDLYLNSPGGEVLSGLGLMDKMEEFKQKGHTLNCIVVGQAASMAAFILQAASKRIMGKNARILIHPISSIFGGYSEEMEDQKRHMEALQTRTLPLLIGHPDCTLTLDIINEKASNRDWWLTAEEAKSYGLIDEII